MQNYKENLRFSVVEISQLSLVIAACSVGRMLFQPIPNIQPMTAMFIIFTYRWGLRKGSLICLLSVLITNFYLGMGVWTISQLLGFFTVLLMIHFLRKSNSFRKSIVSQSLCCGFSGFLFGFMVSVIDSRFYGIDVFWPYYLQGIPFDILHGIGNFFFYLILSPILSKVFNLGLPDA